MKKPIEFESAAAELPETPFKCHPFWLYNVNPINMRLAEKVFVKENHNLFNDYKY